tara:strand:+ start:2722 stop:3198 length:477 start_codon:yes stop_codon:yes gene_type:complete
MGFPLAFIEILLVLICCPILFLIYYKFNKNTLKTSFTQKSIYLHFLVVLGIAVTGILLANLARIAIGLGLIYFFDSTAIKQFGNLLWFTPYENKLATTIFAYLLSVIINLISSYYIFKLYKSKSKLSGEENNYPFYTTLIFIFPITVYLFSFIILSIP